MKLNMEQKQKFYKLIRDAVCPFCKRSSFSFVEKREIFGSATALDIEVQKFVPKSVYTLICTKCGYYSFFNSTIIESL